MDAILSILVLLAVPTHFVVYIQNQKGGGLALTLVHQDN